MLSSVRRRGPPWCSLLMWRRRRRAESAAPGRRSVPATDSRRCGRAPARLRGDGRHRRRCHTTRGLGPGRGVPVAMPRATPAGISPSTDGHALDGWIATIRRSIEGTGTPRIPIAREVPALQPRPSERPRPPPSAPRRPRSRHAGRSSRPGRPSGNHTRRSRSEGVSASRRCMCVRTQKILATTYFPEGLPPEYLRRWRA